MKSHVVDVEQFRRELTLLCFQLKQDGGKATPDAIEHVRCLMQLLGDRPDVIVASDGDSLTTSYLKEFWHNVPWFEEIKFGSKYIEWGNEWPQGRAFGDLSESKIALLEAAVLSLRDSLEDSVVSDIRASGQRETRWSHYRTPSEWRGLRKKVGLPDSESTWRNLRNAPATVNDIQGEPGNENRMVRLTKGLAESWGLELPEFQQSSSK